MLEVFYADVSALDPVRAIPLSSYRRERLARQKTDSQRRKCLGAELLLNYAVCRHAPGLTPPLDIICGEYGKPRLRRGGLHFSLSHSGEYAAVAVSDEEIGLDIQKDVPYKPAIAARFFTPDEKRRIDMSDDRDAAFTDIWCRKESFVKAGGTGIHTPLGTFSVLEMPWIWHSEIPGYHIAACCLSTMQATPDMFDKIELKKLELS